MLWQRSSFHFKQRSCSPVEQSFDDSQTLVGDVADILDCRLLPLIADIGGGHEQHFDKIFHFSQTVLSINDFA